MKIKSFVKFFDNIVMVMCDWFWKDLWSCGLGFSRPSSWKEGV